MKDKHYRYIYKIICLCGDWKGKYYIGQHTTYNLNDNYTGSSTVLPKYWSQYGRIKNVTYKKIILRDNIKSQAELDYWEKHYIGLHLGKEKCLNIHEGGSVNYKIRDIFHTVETLEDGTYRSCDITDKPELYYYNEDIPLYKAKCGKLYSKAIDLEKHGIKFYED